MKTILYIGDFKFSKMNAESQLVLGNAKAFRQIGYNVIFVGNDDNLCRGLNLIDSKQNFYGFDCFNLPGNRNLDVLLRVFKVQKEIETVINMYDVKYIITYGTVTHSIALAKLRNYSKKNSIPFIVNVVDIPSLEHGSKLERIIRKIDRRYRYFIYKRSDGLIAISSCVENFINRNKNMPSIIIPPLKDTELFEKPVCNKNNSIRFIYAGCPFPIDGRVVDEIAYKDRLDLVIDVIGSLLSEKYNLKFDIYGITKAQYTKVVKRQDELLETYANQIKFYGRIPYESCTKKVSEADFLVLIREDTLMSRAGVSTKIVDSITGGTPVITTVFGDIGNYITEGRNGYCINSTQIKSIYNEMKKVCNLPREQIETMKMECYESRIFDYRKYVQELRLFLEKI